MNSLNMSEQALVQPKTEKTYDSTIVSVAACMSMRNCAFMSASLKGRSCRENTQKNSELEKKIMDSGLTYIKFLGISPDNDDREYGFCIANTRFSDGDFKKLAIRWCRDFDQDTVLITYPVYEGSTTSKRMPLSFHGQIYDAGGSKKGSVLKDMTVGDAIDFIDNIWGKDFRTDGVVTVCEKYYRDNKKPSGVQIGCAEFRNMYPDI